MTPDMAKFLRELVRCAGVASPAELDRPELYGLEYSVRQRCKRAGYVTYGSGRWRLTNKGRDAFREWESS